MRVMKTLNRNILHTHHFLKHLNIVKTQIIFLPLGLITDQFTLL